MDGGVLSIPFDKLDEFYRVCVKCIENGEKIFVVEQKTEVYNFFLDIDYKDTEPLDIDTIKGICLDICTKVKGLGITSRCVVSVAEPKPKDGMIKTGVHINWPDIPVDQNGALTLMYHIVGALNTLRPDRDWRTYIDQSVYGDPETGSKGSGFRMPWSHKKGKHTECNGAGCMVCNHTGKLTESEYLPIYRYVNDTLEPMDQTPTVEGLLMATIRTQSEPMCIPVAKTIQRVKRVKKEGAFTAAQTKNEVTDVELKALLETFVRKYLPGQKNARLQKIFKHKNTYLVGTTSKYCENLGRNHNSNHVWFMIRDDHTIRQKCFCRCETMEGRSFGFCKDFSGKSQVLTQKIISILYPEKKKTKKYT
jgi:hypothetical protein